MQRVLMTAKPCRCGISVTHFVGLEVSIWNVFWGQILSEKPNQKSTRFTMKISYVSGCLCVAVVMLLRGSDLECVACLLLQFGLQFFDFSGTWQAR